MAIDFTRYQPPGIYTESVDGPQLAVRSSVPTAVAIFGLTRGYRIGRESVYINPDVDVEGEYVPAVNAVLGTSGGRQGHAGIRVDVDDNDNLLYVKVYNPNTGEVWAENVDWTLHRITQGDDTTPGTRDDLYTIKRVIDGGHIEPGDTVIVEYRYTDHNYFKVYNFFDYDDIIDAYGEPIDSSGNITSELSLMARFAFINGATSIIAVAVDPADPDNPTMADYSAALDKLQDEDQIAILTPATGAQAIQSLVQTHVRAASNNRYERRAILGRDGVAAPISNSTLIENATALSDERIALVAPAKFSYYAPEVNREISLGGQYMAAALAGRTVSQIAAEPLTRKRIFGFVAPDPSDNFSEGDKSNLSDHGLLVVEKNRRNVVWVRHGVTTRPDDILTREWSIIGQQDVMVYRVRDYLDNDGLIGSPIYDTTLTLVKASAESALQSLKRDQIIRDYQGLKVRQIATLPDVLEIRYEWLPAYPLNYLVVRYSVQMLSGDISTETVV